MERTHAGALTEKEDLVSVKKAKKKTQKKKASQAAMAAVAAGIPDDGILEVPAGTPFTVDVVVHNDNPLWKCQLMGLTAAGAPFSIPVGQNQSPFHAPVNAPAGRYSLVYIVTLQNQGAEFRIAALSDIDSEHRVHATSVMGDIRVVVR